MNMAQHREQQGISGCVGHLAVNPEGDHYTLYQEREQADPGDGGDVPVPFHFQRGRAQHVGKLGHHPECSKNYRDMVLPQIAESGKMPHGAHQNTGACFPMGTHQNVQHRATWAVWNGIAGGSPFRTGPSHQPLYCSTVLSNVWAMQVFVLIRKTPPGYQLSEDTHLFRRGNPRTTTHTIFTTWPGPQCGNMLDGRKNTQHGKRSNMGGQRCNMATKYFMLCKVGSTCKSST